MTLHVVSLPHTQTTHDFDHCAYTAKVRKFCDMMRGQGFKVILYSGEENEADCDEHVTCIFKEEQEKFFGDDQVQSVSWDASDPHWTLFNQRVIEQIARRKEETDVICLITGTPQQKIIDAFPYPKHLVVEFGVGYSGIAAPFQIYESYAWMHSVYGEKMGAMQADGRFFDAVIPNYYDISEFPAGDPEDYFVFMSRMTPRKGYQIAIDTTQAIGAKLKIAGDVGDYPKYDHVEYIGRVNAAERGQLLSKARATFMPTLYLEPFGGVGAESLLCGTPVISTDWGAFTEYIEPDIDGFRCRTMGEFINAAQSFDQLDRGQIRARAQQRFGFDFVAPQYTKFFKRLSLLWNKGFYDQM